MDLPLAVVVYAGRADVILHVARAEHAARIDVFKPGNNFVRQVCTRRGPSHSVGRDGSWP